MIAVENLDVYKLSEKLSDIVLDNFDNWNKKTQVTIGYQIIRSLDSIQIFQKDLEDIHQRTEQDFIYIKEVHLKKQKHG